MLCGLRAISSYRKLGGEWQEIGEEWVKLTEAKGEFLVAALGGGGERLEITVDRRYIQPQDFSDAVRYGMQASQKYLDDLVKEREVQ